LEPQSPCRKPQCIKKNKLLCAGSCPELAAYQEYLLATEDKYSIAAPNYGGDDWNQVADAEIEGVNLSEYIDQLYEEPE